jgi:hypothetical protein
MNTALIIRPRERTRKEGKKRAELNHDRIVVQRKKNKKRRGIITIVENYSISKKKREGRETT